MIQFFSPDGEDGTILIGCHDGQFLNIFLKQDTASGMWFVGVDTNDGGVEFVNDTPCPLDQARKLAEETFRTRIETGLPTLSHWMEAVVVDEEKEKELQKRTFDLMEEVAEDTERLFEANKKIPVILTSETMRLTRILGSKDIHGQARQTAILLRILTGILRILVAVEMDQEENPSKEG